MPGRGEGSDWLERMGRRLGRLLGESAAAQPWLLHLHGQTAPPELLERWLYPAPEGRTRPAAPARTPRRPGAPPVFPSHRSPQAPPPDAASSPAPSIEPLDEVAAIPRRPSEPAADAPSPLLAPPPSLPPFLQTRGAGDGEGRRPSLTAEPVLALPRGAAAPADDLSALAAKIQRILDDEARRHGIPV